MMRRLTLTAWLCAVCLLAVPLAAQACLSPDEAREAVSRGEAMPFSSIAQRLTSEYGGQIVKADLCPGGGGLVYRVTVIGRNGEVHTPIVDAASGQTVGGQ